MKRQGLGCWLMISGLTGCAQIEINEADSEQTSNVLVAKERTETAPSEDFQLKVDSLCQNPCSMAVSGTTALSRVAYEADGWPLGESTDAASDFEISYTFNTLGLRQIRAKGYSADGAMCVEASRTIELMSESPSPEASPSTSSTQPNLRGSRPDVPYFYQYANRLHPSATCQNTSIAMVLKYGGWNGVPDDITRAHGKDFAQSPSGLASLFNQYAAANNLPHRITPHTDGTLSGLRAELDRGHPVIIHGYFTSYGHVLVVLGYDNGGYYVNDPAGLWSQRFEGGYGGGGSGQNAYYSKTAFEAAVATANGYRPLPLWYHTLR